MGEGAPPGKQDAPRRSRRDRAIAAAWLIGAMGMALLAITWTLRLWNAPLRIPLAPGGDALPVFTAIKAFLTNGWYLTNPDLAAPFGQSLYDFAGFSGDVLQWLVIGILGLVIHDPGLLMTTYFLLGYAFVTAAGFVVLRSLGGSRPTALALSVIIAMLPYHLAHGEGHIMLANYVAAPVACWLVIRVLLGMPLVTRRGGGRIRSLTTATTLGTVTAVVLTGLTSLYYAVFTLLLLGIAILVRGLATLRWRAVIPGVCAAVGVGAMLIVSILPGLIYQWANGANAGIAVRLPIESEYYSFSLGRLLLSLSGHRIQALSDLGNSYVANSVWISEGDAALGLILGGTFVAMIVAFAVWTIRGRWPASQRVAVARAAMIGAFSAFLIGTFGGVGDLIAQLVSPQIRAWTRITPFLAFFCAIILMVAIEWLRDRTRGYRWGRAFGVAFPIALMFVGIVDQTSPTNIPNYAGNAALWNSQRAFVQRIEAVMPPNAMILQLPIHSFPEGGPLVEMGDYDQLAGYAHSTDLRWSFGAINGRPEAWGLAAARLPLPVLLRGAAAAGFDGVWIDRAGYEDSGKKAIATVRALTGERTLIQSEGGRLVFMDLRPLRASLAATRSRAQLQDLAQTILTPATTAYGAGFYDEERASGSTWRWAQREAVLSVDNTAGSVRSVRWSAELHATPGARVRVSLGGRTLFSRTLTNGATQMVVAIPAPPGHSDVQVSSTGLNVAPASDPRQLHLQFMDPVITYGGETP